jgi:purine nucleoside permease
MMFSGPKTQPLSTSRYFFHHHFWPVPESTESIPQTRNQNKTTYMKLAHCLIALALALFAAPLLQAQIPIKVVVVTTFENGDDITGNGEFQAWAADLPLPIVIHFPQGYHHLRYNPDLGVLGIVTGQGKSHAAASIMGLGMDPRFDLTHAYWIVAAIAGVDPNKASVASAAWANYVVDGDLAYEIDAREIPYGPPWSTGYVPFGDSTPYALPYQAFNANGVNQVYQLNTSLVNWAYDLTEGITLPDDSTLMQVRAGYPTYPNAVKPPFVLIGDDLAADRFWFGDLFNTWAENWITYWCKMGTAGPGNFVMSSQEDAGVSQALQFLTSAGRADNTRELVLRSASDYTLQPAGQTPAQFLASYVSGGFSGYQESLSDAYIVGSVIVKTIANNWAVYKNHVP